MDKPIIIKNFITPELRKYFLNVLTIYQRTNKFYFDSKGTGYGMASNSCIEPGAWTDGMLMYNLGKLREITKKQLEPTYGYIRLYDKYSTLPEHRDRPACEYSASLFIGSDGSHDWPIKMDGKEYSLEPGSAILYKGCEWKHSRDEFLGDWHFQWFLHWVDINGPHADWVYDQRKTLGDLY